ncbi:MAG: glycoside hydrolase family 3 protein [Planctomycetota bacterium]
MLESLSREQKVGQLLIVGIPPGPDQFLVSERLIKDYHVGGIILFEHNVEGMRDPTVPIESRHVTEAIVEMTTRLQWQAAQSSSSLPLLIAVDQEQGSAVVLEKGVTLFPSAMGLAATNNPELVRQAGRVVGEELRALGIGMNLAPVLDINRGEARDFIRDRSFGAGPNWVATYGAAFALGMQDEGLLVCAKHYPGHGQTARDPHQGLPVLRSTEQEIYNSILPFRHLATHGVDAVMTAHIAFPRLDLENKKIPFSLSRRAITQHLRQTLGFDGVVISDDVIGMRAAQEAVGNDPSRAVVKSVLAGNDLTILSGVGGSYSVGPMQIDFTIDDLQHCITDLVDNLSEEQLNASLRRVLRLKSKIYPNLVAADAIPNRQAALATVRRSDHLEIAEHVANRSISIIDDSLHLFDGNSSPLERLDTSDDVLLAVPVFSKDDLTPLLMRHFRVTTVELSYNPKKPFDAEAAFDALVDSIESDSPRLLIFGVTNRDHVDLLDRINRYLSDRERAIDTIVISFRVPYLFDERHLEKMTILSAYSNLKVSNEAVARVLLGEASISSHQLPVSLPYRPFSDLLSIAFPNDIESGPTPPSPPIVNPSPSPAPNPNPRTALPLVGIVVFSVTLIGAIVAASILQRQSAIIRLLMFLAVIVFGTLAFGLISPDQFERLYTSILQVVQPGGAAPDISGAE